MRKLPFLLLALLFASGVWANGVPPLVNADSGGVSGGTSATIGPFTASTAGSLLVITTTLQDTTTTISSITATGCTVSNWQTLTKPGTGVQMIMMYAPNTAGSCTKFVVNWSATSSGDSKYGEYAGMATSSPLDCSASGAGSGTTLTTGTTCSASCTNDTVVVGAGILTGAETFTADDSYTIVIQRGGGSESELLEDKNVASSGTVSAAPTVGSTGQYAIIAASFKQSGSSCGGTPQVPRHKHGVWHS